ncbi:hypothetical protein GGI35DRAFT_474636 [Trichoderma velutinum]
MSFDEFFLSLRGLLIEINSKFFCDGPPFSKLQQATQATLNLPYGDQEIYDTVGFTDKGMQECHEGESDSEDLNINYSALGILQGIIGKQNTQEDSGGLMDSLQHAVGIDDLRVWFPKGMFVDNTVQRSAIKIYAVNAAEDEDKRLVLNHDKMVALSRFLWTGKLLPTARDAYIKTLGLTLQRR